MHTRETWRMDVSDILGRHNDQIGTLQLRMPVYFSVLECGIAQFA